MFLFPLVVGAASLSAAGVGGKMAYNAVQKAKEEKKLANSEPITPTVKVGDTSLSAQSVQKGYIRLNGKEVPIASLDQGTIAQIQGDGVNDKIRMFQGYIDERDRAWKQATLKENIRRTNAKLPKETKEEMAIRKKQFDIEWEKAELIVVAGVKKLANLEVKRREEVDKVLDRKMAISQEQEKIRIEEARLALEAEIRKTKEQEEEIKQREEAERKAEEERIAEEARLAEMKRLEKQKALEKEEAELIQWEQDTLNSLQKLSEEEELQKWEADVAAKQLAEQKLEQEKAAQEKARKELEENKRRIEQERLHAMEEEAKRLKQLDLERLRREKEQSEEMERMQLEKKRLEQASKDHEEHMKRALQETESSQIRKGEAMTFPAIKNPKEYKQYLDDLKKYDDLVACYNSSWTQHTFADKAQDLVKRLRELTSTPDRIDEFFDRRRAWYRVARNTPQERRSGDWKICWQNISRIYEIIFYEVQEQIKSDALEQLIRDVVKQRNTRVEAYYKSNYGIPPRRLAELMEHYTKPQYENNELILRPKKVFDTPESIALRNIYNEKFKGRRLESMKTKMR
jgi:chemotaxis protein histidine kinase CheA